MNWSELEKEREMLNIRLTETMGNKVIEITSEIQSQFNEMPFWVLVSPNTNVQELFEIFLAESKSLREKYPTISLSVGFYEPNYEKKIVSLLEYVDGNELLKSPAMSSPAPHIEQRTTDPFESSVFKSVRDFK